VELSAFTSKLEGRFLRLDHPELGFLRACRACIETAGEAFPDYTAPERGRRIGGRGKSS
jgi:hypothetical protein